MSIKKSKRIDQFFVPVAEIPPNPRKKTHQRVAMTRWWSVEAAKVWLVVGGGGREVVVERWWLVVERWWLVVGVREVAMDFLTQNILNPHCGYLAGCSTCLEGTGMLRVDKGQPIPLPRLPYPQPVMGFKTRDNH